MTDLRHALVTSYLRRPAVQTFAAPRLATERVQRAQLVPSPPVIGASGRAYWLGEDGSVQAEPGWGDTLTSWWNGVTSGLHRLVYQGWAGGVTGVQLPREILSPTAAREYLADALVRFGTVNGWPAAEVAARRDAMLGAGNAATVFDTIARVRAFGPPQTWPGAAAWWQLSDEMGRSAALVSAADAAGLVREVAPGVVQQARDAAHELALRVDRGLDVAGKGAGWGGAALGATLGLGLLGVAVFVGAPYLGAARAAASATAPRS